MSESLGLLFLFLFLVATALCIYLLLSMQKRIERARLDAIRRSRAVTRGMVTEHIVPYLPGFDLDPKDIRFLGTPIEFVAFKGLCEDSAGEVEIVFIEVKTGRSALSARERKVKKAVEQKRISWRVFNPDDHKASISRVS
jgi:predicted Holliday junction resolvase-like endonuclease